MDKNKKKKIGIGIGIVLLIGIIVGVSFAWWSSYATQQSINKITSDCLRIEIEDINNSAINLEKAYPITDAEAEELVPYTFKVTNTCNNSAEYSVQLEIMNLGENQISSQYLSMNFNGEGKKRVTEYQSVEPTYNESDYIANEARYLTSGVLNPKESITYNLKIWIDESVTVNDPVMNKEWIGKVSVTSSMVQFATTNFSEYIMTKNYAYIEKVEHEATEQTPALTDYRYVGANPDNYVYFGCEGDSCTEDNLYRIIGVIPTQSNDDGTYQNRVKLIKANYYTEEESGLLVPPDLENYMPADEKGYRWDTNVERNNKWEESSLQNQVLNGVYWNNLGEYQNYIEPSKWYLGAALNSGWNGYTAEQFYTQERSTTKGYSQGNLSFIGNIGLVYPSDYSYSTINTFWNEAAGTNDSSIANNWLHESTHSEWTITPESGNSGIQVWYLIYTGGIGRSSAAHTFGIRPTFYLKEDVMVVGGNGTESEPYRISTNDNSFNYHIIAESKTNSSIEQIKHEATEQTPALTDYRYVGANPNNYVCFGYDGTRCPDDNLYRIIGVIPTQSSENGIYENRVKLIKANNWEGTTAMNSSYTPNGKGYNWNTLGTNKWEESSLQQTLNNEYYNNLGEYKNYIEKAKWYLGAPDYNNYVTYTTKQFYELERSNIHGKSEGLTNYINNIGLMYPSDYGYTLNGIENALYDNQETYKNNSWLYNLSGGNYYEWTITPESESIHAWLISYLGRLGHDSVDAGIVVFSVRPTFYLKSSVQYTSGDGSIDNPYRIGL